MSEILKCWDIAYIFLVGQTLKIYNSHVPTLYIFSFLLKLISLLSLSLAVLLSFPIRQSLCNYILFLHWFNVAVLFIPLTKTLPLSHSLVIFHSSASVDSSFLFSLTERIPTSVPLFNSFFLFVSISLLFWCKMFSCLIVNHLHFPFLSLHFQHLCLGGGLSACTVRPPCSDSCSFITFSYILLSSLLPRPCSPAHLLYRTRYKFQLSVSASKQLHHDRQGTKMIIITYKISFYSFTLNYIFQNHM